MTVSTCGLQEDSKPSPNAQVSAGSDCPKLLAFPNINKLPFDVLELIFTYTLPVSGNTGKPCINIPLVTSSEPWTLRSVCSVWRQVALRQNTLWNRILIHPPSMFDRRFMSQSTIALKTWALRKKAIEGVMPTIGAIALEIYLIESKPSFVSSALQDLVSRYHTRLNGLSLICDASQFAIITSMASENLSSVKSLDVQFRDMGFLYRDTFGTPGERKPQIFDHANRLDSLQIEGMYRAFWPLYTSNICWDQMRYLHLILRSEFRGVASQDEFLDILGGCKNLLSLTLNIEFLRQSNQSKKILLPILRHLTFHMPLKSIKVDLLEFLILPSLKELILQPQRNQSTSGVVVMLEQSLCALEVLREEMASDAEAERTPKEPDQLPFDQLLPLLSSVSSLTVISALKEHHLHAVGSGELLPRAQVFACASHMLPLESLKALETRFILDHKDRPQHVERLRSISVRYIRAPDTFQRDWWALNARRQQEQRLQEIWKAHSDRYGVELKLNF